MSLLKNDKKLLKVKMCDLDIGRFFHALFVPHLETSARMRQDNCTTSCRAWETLLLRRCAFRCTVAPQIKHFFRFVIFLFLVLLLPVNLYGP